MPSSTMKKKPVTVPTTATTTSKISRPSLIDTVLLTSTPLRRSPVSSIQSTRSTTNLTLQKIFKEKNQTYEDMKLFNLTKNSSSKEKKSSVNSKTRKKRSRSKKSFILQNQNDDDDETEGEENISKPNETNHCKRKTQRSKKTILEEPILKKLRKSTVFHEKQMMKKATGKSSAGSSDGCTTVDEESEEIRLIEQSKLYIEGPGIKSDYSKINEHNSKIGKKLQNLHGHQTGSKTLPSPILGRSMNYQNQHSITVPSVQNISPLKMKTASRITFALPAAVISPLPSNLFELGHPPSPQMPPTTTATSIDTQTDNLIVSNSHEEQCQTDSVILQHQAVQTESNDSQKKSVSVQCHINSDIHEHHVICCDLTTCVCVDQLVKTRQFLVDATNKLELSNISHNSKVSKTSKQTMTVEETSTSIMVLAKSSLRTEQQVIFEQFLSYFHIRYSPTIDETTTHLITDSIDENTPLVCPLTLKVIQATARHLPIISIQWLVASLSHQIIVPAHMYEVFLGDPTYGYHGGFLRSRIPRSQGLFQGITFRLEFPEEHGCSVLLADNRALRELIHLCGGTIVDDSYSNPSSTIVVLCHEIKRKDPVPTAYVKPEWLLASIAQYNLQPFQTFSAHLIM